MIQASADYSIYRYILYLLYSAHLSTKFYILLKTLYKYLNLIHQIIYYNLYFFLLNQNGIISDEKKSQMILILYWPCHKFFSWSSLVIKKLKLYPLAGIINVIFTYTFPRLYKHHPQHARTQSI